MQSILVDADPLFAVDDTHHIHYDSFITETSPNGLRLLTTWPCVVEASYLLGVPQRFELLRWIELGGTLVYPLEPHHLTDIIGWMETYTQAGRYEMDFADASLYWLAHETGVRDIMTVDVRAFSRYRLPDGQSFNIL